MDKLNANTKDKVLIPTNDRTYPFLIKLEEDMFLLVKKDGTLSGDGFQKNELSKYVRDAEWDLEGE